MDFRKIETNLFFAFCPRGGEVWGGMRAGIGLGVFVFAAEFCAGETGAPPLKNTIL